MTPPVSSQKKNLPGFIERFLVSFAYACIPEVRSLIPPEKMARVIQEDTYLMLFHLPVFMQRVLKIGMMVFEWTPLLWGFGFKRFSKMTEETQLAYINDWTYSRLAPKRDLVKGLRALVMTVTCDQEPVWNYIGYAPEKHIQDRIQLRQKITGEKEGEVS